MRDEGEPVSVGLGVAFSLLSLFGVLGLWLPLPDSSAQVRLMLNAAHLPLFALWTALLLRLSLIRCSPRTALIICTALALLVAVGSEVAQMGQPTREADARDVFSNVAGVGLGLAFARWRWRRRFAHA